MKYPDFFNNIDSITLQDPLSNFLGSLEDGLVEFNYLDVVKSAGHSCPTVAGAYIMSLVGLKALYKDELPLRGGVKISFKESSDEGVAGVIANVVTQITGATETFGFKGLNGKFARNNLMNFNDDINSSIKLTRIDNNQTIELIYNPSVCPPSPKQNELMGKIMQGMATKEDKKEFGVLWQQRVEDIFNNIDKVISVR